MIFTEFFAKSLLSILLKSKLTNTPNLSGKLFLILVKDFSRFRSIRDWFPVNVAKPEPLKLIINPILRLSISETNFSKFEKDMSHWWLCTSIKGYLDLFILFFSTTRDVTGEYSSISIKLFFFWTLSIAQ